MIHFANMTILFIKIYVQDDEGNCDYFGWVDEVDQVLTCNANECEEIWRQEFMDKVNSLGLKIRMLKYCFSVISGLLILCLVLWIGRHSA